MMKNKTTRFIAPLIATLFLCQLAPGQEIYQWRGPDRNGKYNETGLLSQWPPKGPQLLWSVETLGPGYAAPVITPDKLFVMGVEKGISTLFAFDLYGSLLWKVGNGQNRLLQYEYR